MKKKLSLIIAAIDTFKEIKHLLHYVEKQSICDCLETILLCRTKELLAAPDGALSNVPGLSIVECGEDILLHEARAIGIRKAQTPCISILEDHCFPEPLWAEHTLSRMEESWAGVGPAMANANPQTALSQAAMVMGYGEWLSPTISGESLYIPGYNSTFQRSLLMEREDLETDMLANSLMQADLRSKGHRFYIEKKAVMHHWNTSKWEGIPPEFSSLGRSLEACRAKDWGIGKRTIYGLATPLIAALRWNRGLTAFLRTRKNNSVSVLALAWAAIIAIIWAYNELLGFWFGFGNSVEVSSDVERNRARYLQEGEWPKPFGMVSPN